MSQTNCYSARGRGFKIWVLWNITKAFSFDSSKHRDIHHCWLTSFERSHKARAILELSAGVLSLKRDRKSYNAKTEHFLWPQNLLDEKWVVRLVVDLRVLSVLNFSSWENRMCHELAHSCLLVHLHILQWKSLLVGYLLSSHPVRLWTLIISEFQQKPCGFLCAVIGCRTQSPQVGWQIMEDMNRHRSWRHRNPFLLLEQADPPGGPPWLGLE